MKNIDIAGPLKYINRMKLKLIFLMGALLTVGVCPAFANNPAPRPSSSIAAPEKNFTITNERDLDNLKKLHLTAEKFILKRDFNKAAQIYLDIILLEPDDDVAYTNLGHTYLMQGLNEKAAEAFGNAMHINPDNTLAQFGLMKLGYFHNDETAESESHLIKDNDPTYVMAAQTALKNSGLYRGAADGTLNPKFKQALQQFQKMHNLNASGRLTSETLEALESYLYLKKSD